MLDGLGNQIGNESTHLNKAVENGLFNLNVYFGFDEFDGFEDYFFEVSVRKSSAAGAFTILSPLQSLQAVPLATNLTNGTASTGQVLTFNGFQWSPATPNTSPWSSNADGINYIHGESQGVGINSTNPNADLNIKGTNDGDLLRIEQNTLTSFGKTAFYVDDNGGASVGTWITPPALGLLVNGDTKQSITSDGMMKFMIAAFCSSTSASISRQYNGVNNNSASISNGALSGTCKITFPFDISNRFFQVSVVRALSGRSANCQASGSDLNCARFNTNTNAGDNGNIMVLVY